MSPKVRIFALHAGLLLSAFGALNAAAANTYQVTGPILSLTPTTITVQKNDEKWEIARDTNAKGDGNLKVGDRVTIYYRMTATKIETSGTGNSTGDKAPSGTSSPATPKTKKTGDR